MIKSYSTLLLFSLVNLSLCCQELAIKEQLEKLRKDSTSFLNRLPRELVAQLVLHSTPPPKQLEQVIQAIESAHTFQNGLEKLDKLKSQPEYASYFLDLAFMNAVIYLLVKRFDQPPEYVARELNTPGAYRWIQAVFFPQWELYKAAIKGELERVREFIQQGLSVNGFTSQLDTPLMAASFGNSANVVKYIIERGANVNARNVYGASALMWAQTPEIARLLLSYGANPTIKNDEGKTAVDNAIALGRSTELIEVLREALECA